MTYVHGVADVRPTSLEPARPEAIWEQTRRPAWVKGVNGVGRGLRASACDGPASRPRT